MTNKTPPPSRTADQFIVRFPDGMRDRIAAEAKRNNRSMNSEIVARLEDSFHGPSETMNQVIDLLHKYKMSDGVLAKARLRHMEAAQQVYETRMGLLASSARLLFAKVKVPKEDQADLEDCLSDKTVSSIFSSIISDLEEQIRESRESPSP